MSGIIPGPSDRGITHWSDKEIATMITFANYLAQFTAHLPTEVASITEQFMRMQNIRVDEARTLRSRASQIGTQGLMLELARELCRLHADPTDRYEDPEAEALTGGSVTFRPLNAITARQELSRCRN